MEKKRLLASKQGKHVNRNPGDKNDQNNLWSKNLIYVSNLLLVIRERIKAGEIS